MSLAQTPRLPHPVQIQLDAAELQHWIVLGTRVMSCAKGKAVSLCVSGTSAGVGGNSTLIALGTDAAVDAFCEGKAVMGDDVSFSLGGSGGYLPRTLRHACGFLSATVAPPSKLVARSHSSCLPL